MTSAMQFAWSAGAFRKAGFEVIALPADFRTGWGEANLLEKWLPAPIT
jgi:hypothetical protein